VTASSASGSPSFQESTIAIQRGALAASSIRHRSGGRNSKPIGPGKMLSQDGGVSSVRALRADPPGRPIFARPDTDSKTFDGGIWSRLELDALLNRLDNDLWIVTASPTAIDAEYRLFIVASEVVAASEYRRNGQTSLQGFVPNEAVDLAIEADRTWRPAAAYAIDVARSGERFGIVEANCITAAHYAASRA
jgi:hypothetical protein